MIIGNFACYTAGVHASLNNLFFLHRKLFLCTPMCRLFSLHCHQDRFYPLYFPLLVKFVIYSFQLTLFLDAANFTSSCRVYSKTSNWERSGWFLTLKGFSI